MKSIANALAIIRTMIVIVGSSGIVGVGVGKVVDSGVDVIVDVDVGVDVLANSVCVNG